MGGGEEGRATRREARKPSRWEARQAAAGLLLSLLEGRAEAHVEKVLGQVEVELFDLAELPPKVGGHVLRDRLEHGRLDHRPGVAWTQGPTAGPW